MTVIYLAAGTATYLARRAARLLLDAANRVVRTVPPRSVQL
jgi:hypothetical protein